MEATHDSWQQLNQLHTPKPESFFQNCEVHEASEGLWVIPSLQYSKN